MDDSRLVAMVASIICAETCGLTSECKSREAAAALFAQGYLAGGVSDAGLKAAMAKAAELGIMGSESDFRLILAAASAMSVQTVS